MITKIKDYIFDLAVKLIAKIKWKQRKTLSDSEIAALRTLLAKNYFIIATRRSNFLSCFFINLSHFLLTGHWGYYTHILMNLEDEVNKDADFRLIEATTKGTQYSSFEQVTYGVDGIALLKPKNMTLLQWTRVMDKAKEQLGKPYDTLFDIKNDQKVNCVELVRLALMALPDYEERFPDFEKSIAKRKNLTPQMFLECTDFEVYLEIRK